MVRRSGSSGAFPGDEDGDSLPLTRADGRGRSYQSIPTTTTPLAASNSASSSSIGHQQQDQHEDDNVPTVTYTRGSLNISTPSASSSSSSSVSSRISRLWRLTEGEQRGFHLLQGGAVLAVAALCLGVGVLIGQSQSQLSLNNSYGINPLYPPQLQDAQVDWPAQPLLGNAWTPQDVQSVFTAYHFTDAHIEPLYGAFMCEGGCGGGGGGNRCFQPDVSLVFFLFFLTPPFHLSSVACI